MHLEAISRKSTIVAIILLAVILLAAVLRFWFAPYQVELADSGAHERVWLAIVAILLYFGNALLQGKSLQRTGLCSGKCALPMPIYGLLACGVFVAPDMMASSMASICFAFALYQLLRSLHNVEEKDSVFLASMLLGVTTLFYPPCIVLFATIPFAVFTLALSLRQVLLMLIGYVLPLFAASYVTWYRGGGLFDVCSNIYSGLAIPQMSEISQVPNLAIIFVATVAVLFVWGSLRVVIRPTKTFMLARVRRAFYFYLCVFLSTLAMLLIPGCDLSVCAIVAVPLTILLSFVLDILPGAISTLAYWALLLLFTVHLFVA